MIRGARPEVPAFQEVYETLYPTIYRIAFRICGNQGAAEDLCQEAFIKLFERDQSLPDLEQTKYWLIRVVRNIALNYEKRKARERKAYERLEQINPRYAESGEAQLLRQEDAGFIQWALDRLPFSLRVVIVLKEYGGMNYREIGSLLGLSAGNVKVRVFRARKSLAGIIKEEAKHVP